MFIALDVLCDWLSVQVHGVGSINHSHGPRSCDAWHKPFSGSYKCNFDAAMFSDIQAAGDKLVFS